MNDFEILEHIQNNYINMLFKEDNNKERFINFLNQQGKLGKGRTISSFMAKRHISFFYSDFSPSESCLTGNWMLDGFEECYYEDLFNNYAVSLI